MTKISVCCTLYCRNDLHLWYTFICKRIISLGIFSIVFSKFWFLGSLSHSGGGGRGGGLKGQKMTQHDKTFCLSHSVYQEPYIIWHTCVKWWYLQQSFWFFKILIFGVLGVGKRVKNDPKWQKVLPVSLSISGTIHHLVHMCKMIISPANFLIFQNFDFWHFKGVKG